LLKEKALWVSVSNQKQQHFERILKIKFECVAGTVSVLKVNRMRRLLSTARDVAILEDQLLSALRGIKVGHKDVVSMGLVKDLSVNAKTGQVQFSLVSSDTATRLRCEEAAASLDWVKSKPVVSLRGPTSTVNEDIRPSGLEGVRNIIAVHSCKGGVGKSTVAVNLACALPGKVGILDCDVFGPSLPTMVVPPGERWKVHRGHNDKTILPVDFHGLTCMSYGFVSPGNSGGNLGDQSSNAATVLRGPIISNIVSQLALKTDWGSLDYLVLDMPPGTGDIHLSIGQQLNIDAAVLVTTPQTLSFVDVIKGLAMFDQLKVPTVAVVENMAWFDGDDGKRYFPFGPGHKSKLVDQYGIKNSFSFPILDSVSESGDSGTPYYRSFPDSPVSLLYKALADGVQREVADTTSVNTTVVTYDEQRQSIVVRCIGDNGAEELLIPPLELRKKLRKVDSMLGMQIEYLDEQVRPLKVQRMGNYAVSISWSDGHDTSIYTYEDLRALGNAILHA